MNETELELREKALKHLREGKSIEFILQDLNISKSYFYTKLGLKSPRPSNFHKNKTVEMPIISKLTTDNIFNFTSSKKNKSIIIVTDDYNLIKEIVARYE